MNSPLKVYQIYFSKDTRPRCYNHDAVSLYDNTDVNPAPFFENAVIENLIKKRAHHESDFFGVWSWQHARKIRAAKARGFNIDSLVNRCQKGDFHVLSWYGHMKRQQIFHNKVRALYNAAFDRLMLLLGIKFNASMNPRFIIMQNHFIMRSDLYEQYVLECLVPAMHLMQDDEQLAKILSYRTPYKTNSEVNYTFHTFILERLVSTWIHVNKKIVCQNWGPFKTATS